MEAEMSFTLSMFVRFLKLKTDVPVFDKSETLLKNSVPFDEVSNHDIAIMTRVNSLKNQIEEVFSKKTSKGQLPEEEYFSKNGGISEFQAEIKAWNKGINEFLKELGETDINKNASMQLNFPTGWVKKGFKFLIVLRLRVNGELWEEHHLAVNSREGFMPTIKICSEGLYNFTKD